MAAFFNQNQKECCHPTVLLLSSCCIRSAATASSSQVNTYAVLQTFSSDFVTKCQSFFFKIFFSECSFRLKFYLLVYVEQDFCCQTFALAG
jgi:hypothetical protein